MRNASGLLDRADEGVGRQQPEIRMLPPNQRLGAVDLTRAALYLRLEVEPELALLERLRKIADDADQTQRPVVLTEPVDARRLVPRERLAAGARCAPAELRRVSAVLREARDPRRGLQRYVGAADPHARAQQVCLVFHPLEQLLRVEAGQGEQKLVCAHVADELAFA